MNKLFKISSSLITLCLKTKPDIYIGNTKTHEISFASSVEEIINFRTQKSRLTARQKLKNFSVGSDVFGVLVLYIFH